MVPSSASDDLYRQNAAQIASTPAGGAYQTIYTATFWPKRLTRSPPGPALACILPILTPHTASECRFGCIFAVSDASNCRFSFHFAAYAAVDMLFRNLLLLVRVFSKFLPSARILHPSSPLPLLSSMVPLSSCLPLLFFCLWHLLLLIQSHILSHLRRA